jgi:hypothetical protein
MANQEAITVKFTRPQATALLVLLEQADQAGLPAALRTELVSARHQLTVWLRASAPEDASELGEGGS